VTRCVALASLLASCAELSGEPQLVDPACSAGPLVVPGLAAEERRPVAVLIERGPSSASGATVPTVIVYEDGLIVRNEVLGEIGRSRLVRRQGRIGEPVLAGFISGLLDRGLWSLPPRMWATDAADQPSVEILVRALGEAESAPRWYYVHQYGVGRGGSSLEEDAAGEVPEAFLRAYRTFLSLPARDPWDDISAPLPAQRYIDRVSECGSDWSWAALKGAPAPPCEDVTR
jgi:hypothetical protein